MHYRPMSVQLDASSFALRLRSRSLSHPLSGECAYRQAGVACVTRVVVTIPVDIPAISANVSMDRTLLLSFKL